MDVSTLIITRYFYNVSSFEELICKKEWDSG